MVVLLIWLVGLTCEIFPSPGSERSRGDVEDLELGVAFPTPRDDELRTESDAPMNPAESIEALRIQGSTVSANEPATPADSASEVSDECWGESEESESEDSDAECEVSVSNDERDHLILQAATLGLCIKRCDW